MFRRMYYHHCNKLKLFQLSLAFVFLLKLFHGQICSVPMAICFMIYYRVSTMSLLSNAAVTLNGFDNQERNLTFVKTAFQVLKLKFLGCSMTHAFSLIHKQKIAGGRGKEITFYKFFFQYLVVKPACVNAA